MFSFNEITGTDSERWAGISRPYTVEDVLKLRPSVLIDHTLAKRGSRKLWDLITNEPYVHALGALTGGQAVQMVRAGLQSIYVSGWQAAADNNTAGQTFPDRSLYPSNTMAVLTKRLNQALLRADQIEKTNLGKSRDWLVPLLVDAEAGFGGPLMVYELFQSLIEAGASGIHLEDQLNSEKKCGHLGGKVLLPCSQFIRNLVAARLSADVAGVPIVIVGRSDANSSGLISNDIDPVDRQFLTGNRNIDGYHEIKNGPELAIARAKAFAPYCDVIWWETSSPDLDEAKHLADAIHESFPEKPLAYNCSPSFNWSKKLSTAQIATFQQDLGSLGYKYQFITSAGFHSLNYGMYELATDYQNRDMSAFVTLQEKEFKAEANGYTAIRQQLETANGYYDEVLQTIYQGEASTAAMPESTEQDQFNTSK
ncbi:isocitrate lyase [Pedobacter sp. BAL39]|uniref:isocitrate lyase n=1 Tax=Pedobacter sp. BAL39 TaxID=391596 RepID=UPI0001559448|nr:isocitrate lyase [Pedobacter sp. BAL39]EDM35382.1 isocitrate lyase [Pedobacter sp. BAL39]